MRTFETLVDEAWAQPTEGWDFSWLGNRHKEDPVPWDYTAMVLELVRTSPDLLDLGTGGGEWLARLSFRPARTLATEDWAPNLSVAQTRLKSLGIDVVAYDKRASAVDPESDVGMLPFPDASFHLITNRHESFEADEVARVLVGGGHFITQQVGEWDALSPLLGLTGTAEGRKRWQLSVAIDQLESAGLEVLNSGEARPVTHLADIGALVWYLKMIPWAIPDFTPNRYRECLRDLDRRCNHGPIEFEEERFWVLARKRPGSKTST
jgi:SAM-dependent methyltransferase